MKRRIVRVIAASTMAFGVLAANATADDWFGSGPPPPDHGCGVGSLVSGYAHDSQQDGTGLGRYIPNQFGQRPGQYIQAVHAYVRQAKACP